MGLIERDWNPFSGEPCVKIATDDGGNVRPFVVANPDAVKVYETPVVKVLVVSTTVRKSGRSVALVTVAPGIEYRAILFALAAVSGSLRVTSTCVPPDVQTPSMPAY